MEQDQKTEWVEASDASSGFSSNVLQPFWFVLHMVSLDYPVSPSAEDRDKYTRWFLLTLSTIPCLACRENIPQVLQRLGWDPTINMASRTAFSRFVYRLHCEINRSLSKRNQLTFSEMNAFFDQLRATECTNDSCTKPGSGPTCVVILTTNPTDTPK